MLQRHAADFNLTDEQLDKLEAMQVQCELEKIDLLAALRKAKIRFRAKIRLEDAPEAEVIAAIDEVARCEAELRKMRYRHLQAGRKVLKPDQRGKVKAFRRKRQLEKAKAVARGAPGDDGAQHGLTPAAPRVGPGPTRAVPARLRSDKQGCSLPDRRRVLPFPNRDDAGSIRSC